MWLGYYTQRAPSWIDTIHFLYQILCGQNRSVKSQCSAEFHHKFPPGHVAFSLCDVSVGPVFGSEIDSLRHKWRSDFEAVSCDNGDNTLVRLDVFFLGLVMVRNLNKVLDQTSTTFVQNGLGILASGLQKTPNTCPNMRTCIQHRFQKKLGWLCSATSPCGITRAVSLSPYWRFPVEQLEPERGNHRNHRKPFDSNIF